jgi:hypothetical protein
MPRTTARSRGDVHCARDRAEARGFCARAAVAAAAAGPPRRRRRTRRSTTSTSTLPMACCAAPDGAARAPDRPPLGADAEDRGQARVRCPRAASGRCRRRAAGSISGGFPRRRWPTCCGSIPKAGCCRPFGPASNGRSGTPATGRNRSCARRRRDRRRRSSRADPRAGTRTRDPALGGTVPAGAPNWRAKAVTRWRCCRRWTRRRRAATGSPRRSRHAAEGQCRRGGGRPEARCDARGGATPRRRARHDAAAGQCCRRCRRQ